MALAPKFAALGEKYGDRIIFLKMNRAENREIMKTLVLRGVPTIIFMSGGTEICGRLTGDAEATAENIEAAITKILAV
ncbi:thioredoxin family protein [Cloacibacillus porcorum]|uniref:thioredoxin family protein n=1 Tax=Cloacibacillus porcorum TaxID=1197717 RepID=UPI0023F3EB61|nr:thioredoxin family protein [Cloacibacillus porcorum]